MSKRDSKCKHCDKYIYRNARSATAPWRHVETGWTACRRGINPHPENKAEPK